MTGAISSSSQNPPQESQITERQSTNPVGNAQVDNLQARSLEGGPRGDPAKLKGGLGGDSAKPVFVEDTRGVLSSAVISISSPGGDLEKAVMEVEESVRGEGALALLHQEVSQKKYTDRKPLNSTQVYAAPGSAQMSSPSHGAKRNLPADIKKSESRKTSVAGLRQQPEDRDVVHAHVYPHKRSRAALSSADVGGAAEQSIVIQTDQAGDSTTYLFQRQWSEEEAPRFDPVRSMASMRHEFGEHGGVNMSVEASATFTVMEPETMQKIFMGQLGPDRDFFLYSRHFNPTVLHLGKQLAAMEGTEAAYCTASGMAAISAVILQLCSTGDHVVASNRLYGGTHALLAELFPRIANIRTTFVDVLNLTEVEAAIQPGRTKALFFETISNPTLNVADIPALSAIGHRHSLQVVADNTFAALVVSPAVHGVDIIVHSISKFISGNSDIIAGVVCGPSSLINAMMDLHQGTLMLLGPTLNATVASVIAGRLPHLALRVREHSVRALEFAKRLQSLGLSVIYPGLPTHPQHHILSLLVNKSFGYGGLLCLDLGSKERAYDLMRYLQNGTQFGFMAVSLGYHDTLMSCSGVSTSSELTQEEQEIAGISPGLVRISIGYTGSLEQRWEQMLEALVALGLVSPTAEKRHHGDALGLSDRVETVLHESNKHFIGITI